jgi:hypothetical protein
MRKQILKLALKTIDEPECDLDARLALVIQ